MGRAKFLGVFAVLIFAFAIFSAAAVLAQQRTDTASTAHDKDIGPPPSGEETPGLAPARCGARAGQYFPGRLGEQPPGEKQCPLDNN